MPDPKLLPKTAKQTTTEDLLARLTQARDDAVEVLGEFRMEKAFSAPEDQVGHFMTHGDNLQGSFRVLIDQLQRMVDRLEAARKPPEKP